MKYLSVFIVLILFLGCAKTKEEKSLTKVDGNITIRLEGKVLPMNNVKILANASGYVKKVYVKNGDKVKKGDLLYSLDDKLLKLKIKRAKESLRNLHYLIRLNRRAGTKDKASLDLAAIELKKMSFLESKNHSSQFETDTYKKAYITNLDKEKTDYLTRTEKIDGLRTKIKDKELELKTLEMAHKYTNGYAPVSGFVMNFNINPKQQLTKNFLVCHIVNLDYVIVKAGLASGLLPFVHKNQKVRVNFVTTPPYSVEATITKVNPIIDKKFDLMTVDIKIKNHNYILQDGVRALVTVNLPKDEQEKVKNIFSVKHELLDVRSDI